MGLFESQGRPALTAPRAAVLCAFLDGVAVIGQLAVRFDAAGWHAPTPCPEWLACDLAGHLRCAADDYDEYFDDAPGSRLARLMATGAHPDALRRKLARQNAAELAALPNAPPGAHIAAFTQSARAYARRAAPGWDLPHHQYREVMVTVGDMAGAVCAEWHLHAWDLAQALGLSYRPASPEIVLAGWRAGMPHAPVPAAAGPEAGHGPLRSAAAGSTGQPRADGPDDDPWLILLRASGRSLDWAAQPRRAALR